MAQSKPVVSSQPSCFYIKNTASYGIYGNIQTDTYQNEDGIDSRHRVNFSLEPRQRREFCTSGPFFEGGRVELILRTLFPVFRCMTLPVGEIEIKARPMEDGGFEWQADCR